MSHYEMRFRAKYPHTRVVESPSGVHGMSKFTVYAGDYVCADGLSKLSAFKRALAYEESGLITPDPDETPSELFGDSQFEPYR
jgi:hypothetical protein